MIGLVIQPASFVFKPIGLAVATMSAISLPIAGILIMIADYHRSNVDMTIHCTHLIRMLNFVSYHEQHETHLKRSSYKTET